MPELTLMLALLIRKDIISVDEARSILKSSKEGVVNDNLGEMVTKIDKALKKKDKTDTISAAEFMKDL